MQLFHGTGVALVTPFKKDFSIDVEALKKLVNYVIDGGVQYIVVLGTTGEPATLTNYEKQLVINTVVNENKGKLPLVLGVGGNYTDRVIEQLNKDLSGFSAILSVSPYYNKPTQEGIYQHFSAIAKASPLPIILYNVPGRTASNMLPETVLRLANDFKNIIGIKEAAGDMVQAMKLIQQKPKDFLVISGDDMLALPITLAGGVGVISVIGVGFPKQFSQLIQFALNKNVDEAYKIQYQISDCIDMIFEQGNPAGIKKVLEIKGITNDNVRLPLVSTDDNLSNKIKSFVTNL